MVLLAITFNDVLNKHKDKPSESTLTVPKKVLPYLGFHSDAIATPHPSSLRSRPVAHQAALLLFHLLPSLARAIASSQDFQPTIALSLSTVRRQVVLRRPTFLLPVGVQLNAGAQRCSLDILRTCPVSFSLLPYSSLPLTCTSCSFIRLIIRYYVRPEYAQASFKTLVMDGV